MTSLRNVLLIDALSSGATGLALVTLASPVSSLFGASGPGAFVEVGIFLLGFAAVTFGESRKGPLRPRMIQLLIALDILWITASVSLVAFGFFNLTVTGYLLISLVALWVGAMAYLKASGLKQLFV